MTMVIDKNTPTYLTRYVELKKLFKSYTKEDRDYLTNVLEISETFTTIEGIDKQIEGFISNVGFVFYGDLEKEVNGYRKFNIKKMVLTAKEVEDD